MYLFIYFILFFFSVRGIEPDCDLENICTCTDGFVLENDVCVHGKVIFYTEAVNAHTAHAGGNIREREREMHAYQHVCYGDNAVSRIL